MPDRGKVYVIDDDEAMRDSLDFLLGAADFHVTLLRLLGLDDNKLTFYHGGRFKQLSQFGGTPIKEIMA